MKFHITRRETLALVTFIVPKPTANLEQAHARMSAWDALGATGLAFAVADHVGLNVPFDPAPWVNNSSQVVDLHPMVVDFFLKQLEGEVPGIFSEVLRPLQDRLISLRDKTYKLPPELRQLEEAAQAPVS